MQDFSPGKYNPLREHFFHENFQWLTFVFRLMNTAIYDRIVVILSHLRLSNLTSHHLDRKCVGKHKQHQRTER